LGKPHSMKPLYRHNRPISFISLIFLIIVALTIWVFGPLLVIHGYAPLQNTQKKILLIAIVFLAWGIKIYFFNTTSNQTSLKLSVENLKKLYAMQARFKGAAQFLKKTLIQKNGEEVNLFELPWYLLIGPHHSGKTSLLAKSNIKFVLAKQFKQEQTQLTASENCDWWVTRDLVIVDVPAHYIFHKKTKQPHPASYNRFLWSWFLELTQKFRKKQLQGLLITLDFSEILKESHKPSEKSLLIPLRKCILQLQQQFDDHSLPFYIVVTKCDLIPGFIDFFSDHSNDEITQPWGITIPPLKHNENLINLFLNRFNALIKRLNKQVIWRLHQEKNATAKSFIKDFPLQIECLKKNLADVLKTLNIPNLNLQGVYLTSALQATQEEESTYFPVIQNQQVQTALIVPQTMAGNRAYFIKQLILQAIQNTFESPKTRKKPGLWNQRLIYAGAGLAIMIVVVILGIDFQRSIQQTYNLQTLLTQYQLTTQSETDKNARLTKALPLLNMLRNNALAHHPLAGYHRLFNFYTSHSYKSAEQIYHDAIKIIVTPELKHYLETYLKNPADKSSLHLYTALNTYLILGETQQSHPDFSARVITQLLPGTLTTQQSEELAAHFQVALAEPHSLPLDNTLISQTRKLLWNLPASQLAFIILKNTNNNLVSGNIHWDDNTNNNTVITSQGFADQIPTMFTASQLNIILSEEIPKAVNESLNGNSVLGAPLKISAGSDANIEQMLKTLYINAYVSAWENVLTHIQTAQPHSLAQLDDMLSHLINNSSPLIQLLQIIQQNTAFDSVLSASYPLQELNNLLLHADQPQNALFQTFAALKALHNELSIILQSSNANEAAFLVAKMRFQNSSTDFITQLRAIARTNPSSIKTILEKSIDNSWHFILEQASLHIQNSWKNLVIPSYQTVAYRYPFKPNVTDEVDFQQFSNFLGPQGTLTNFYNDFLKPFINMLPQQWEWRQFDNQQLIFSKSFLQQLQYVTQFQQTVFPKGDSILSIPFTLKPVNLSSNSQNASLNINGQLISYHPAVPHSLNWPGTHSFRMTTLHFNAFDNHPIKESFTGDWAWFRLINNSTYKIISNKELLITFTCKGYTVKYKLLTETDLNPFLASNWEKVQLPEDLV
jgi:type VI secretion system protein ImpL